MAKYTIYSKDGSAVRYSGCPRYVGSYLKVSYMEFVEISSPVPIEWEVGDYMDYDRTGLRYKLYSIPQPKKQARKSSSGDAFVYKNVQFHCATKQLDTALFTDTVLDVEKNIHFSTTEGVSTYEDVGGIARRIQACMDEIYPDAWEIKVVAAESGSGLASLLAEQKAFSVSGGTCLSALNAIYDTWENVGWSHTYDAASGKNVVTIGAPNIRDDGNTTSAFLYGKGKGLSAISKSLTNSSDFCTRLYAYGSDRNLPARYYNGKQICNAKSVNIVNLMIPLSKWGKDTDPATGNVLPSGPMAYIEDPDIVAKYGIVPKRAYFTGGDNDEIYPSVAGMTVSALRTAKAEAGDINYVPSAIVYTDGDERLDEIRSAVNPTDSGVVNGDEHLVYEETYAFTKAAEKKSTPYSAGLPPVTYQFPIFSYTTTEGTNNVIVRPSCEVSFVGVVDSLVTVKQYVVAYAIAEDGSKYAMTPEVATLSYSPGDNLSSGTVQLQERYLQNASNVISEVYVYLTIEVPWSSDNKNEITVKAVSGSCWFGFRGDMASSFTVVLKQIGMDIQAQAKKAGSTASISMLDGMCGGRTFEVKSCAYRQDTDDWQLRLSRVTDSSTEVSYPNADYPVSAGDHFVVLGISMPDFYVSLAEQKLYEAALALYKELIKGSPFYEPEIDAKRMAESGEVLKEGMYMRLEDEDLLDGGSEYILIDTLTITEGDASIPTYKVTLREKKKTSSSSSGSSSSSSSVSGGSYTTSATIVGVSDRTFVYTQSVPSKTWTIEHNLGKRPSVTVTDSAGTVVLGQVTYDADDPLNKVTVTFSSEFSGTASLN